MIRLEISTDHGLVIWDLPAVPRVGDYLRLRDVHSPGHDDDLDRAERVASVLWHADGVVTVDCNCEPFP